jgi:hypothetical protein
VASEPEGSSVGRGFGAGYAIVAAGFQFAFVILLFLGGGFLVDRWLGTRPVFTLLGVAVGLAAGFYAFLTSRRGGSEVRRSVALVVATLGAISLLPGLASAQGTPVSLRIDSATVVRLHLAAGRTVAGRLVIPFEPGSAEFAYCPYPSRPCSGARDPRVVTIEASRVMRVDVAAGYHSSRGALIGGAVGLALGLLVASIPNPNEPAMDPPLSRYLLYFSTCVGFSGLMGWFVGSGSRVWQPAP